jgi:hypothetical protein
VTRPKKKAQPNKRRRAAERLRAMDPTSGSPVIQTSASPTVSISAPAKTRDLHRLNGRLVRKQTFVLERDQLRALKTYCVAVDRTMSAVAGEAIAQYLATREH